jgi:tryptophanyl-tRNA synthetase
MKKVLFSGIQPTGQIHIGNYLGAIKQWVELQEQYESIISIADYHAITSDFDPAKMPEKIINSAIDLLACGIDPEKSTLFVQSDVPQHTELAWILNNFCNIGELERMTQYKEKKQKQTENVGLFDYPVLQAADILIYSAGVVPVGEDQIQHIELTRAIARRFNQKFGQTFTEPKAIINKTSRILGLDGSSKMSKSNSESTHIALSDSAEKIKEKVARAQTDIGNETEISPATQNLLNLLEQFAGDNIAQKYFEQRKNGTIKYSELKPVLADAIVDTLKPIQEKRKKLGEDPKYVLDILQKSAEKLQPRAKEMIEKVKKAMGLELK